MNENSSESISSVAQSCLTLCDPMDCRTPGFPVHHQLKLMSIASVMPSNHLVLDHPLLLLPSLFPSIRVFSKESALCIRWPVYWSVSIGPTNEYSGLIFFRIDWLDFLAVQGILKSLKLILEEAWFLSKLRYRAVQRQDQLSPVYCQKPGARQQLVVYWPPGLLTAVTLELHETVLLPQVLQAREKTPEEEETHSRKALGRWRSRENLCLV